MTDLKISQDHVEKKWEKNQQSACGRKILKIQDSLKKEWNWRGQAGEKGYIAFIKIHKWQLSYNASMEY